ncbi:ricin-type beta-trefoil lectin domain protein [Streptomyces sp. NBC_01304]|uniref:ricin-type beta-trefoil lectin domain protein n=1 Tax=Streptomyces sp. NBC_01304 TaxID=2903818 RepID=UPI002E162C22|nr:ricin-type beta-trefoil lectin domain protein [Streptomyces sp. NBC_01304]
MHHPLSRLRTLAVAAALALCATLGLTSPAQAAGQTPGTYTNYGFPSGTSALTEATFGTTVQSDPGRGNVYWAHQFGFTNSVGGYVGMQRWRTGTGMFLFSLWDATAARPGSGGTYCQPFEEGGTGYTCRYHQAFAAGHGYRYRLSPDGDGWYKATITDTTTGSSFVLGSLQTGAGSRISASGMVDWVEYFDWNNNAATCLDEPYSKARFDVPTGVSTAGASVTASITSTSTSSTCTTSAKVTSSGGYSTHEDGIGNSSSGSITGIGGKCADVSGGGSADGTPIVLWGCSGGNHQNWVRAGDGTVRALFKCLTVSGTDIQLRTCSGAAAQKWQRDGSALVNPATGKCLDAADGNSTDGTRLVLYACHGGANQQWQTPA